MNPRGRRVGSVRTVEFQGGYATESAVRTETVVVYIPSNARSRRSFRRALDNAPDPAAPLCGPDCEQLGSFARACVARLIPVSLAQLDTSDGTTALLVSGLPGMVAYARQLPEVVGSHHALAIAPPRPQRTDPLAPARCPQLARARREASERAADAERNAKDETDAAGRRLGPTGVNPFV